jgi:hypothetical protein
MKALACPMLAHEYLNILGAPSWHLRSCAPRDEATNAGSSNLWYSIGFGLGLAFSLNTKKMIRLQDK